MEFTAIKAEGSKKPNISLIVRKGKRGPKKGVGESCFVPVRKMVPYGVDRRQHLSVECVPIWKKKGRKRREPRTRNTRRKSRCKKGKCDCLLRGGEGIQTWEKKRQMAKERSNRSGDGQEDFVQGKKFYGKQTPFGRRKTALTEGGTTTVSDSGKNSHLRGSLKKLEETGATSSSNAGGLGCERWA